MTASGGVLMKPQRFSINAAAKLGNLALDGLITLIVVAYFVGRLGSEAYGLIPWLSSLFVLFTIIPTAVQTAAGRFVTHALGRKDVGEAGQYYSTTSFLLFGLGAAGMALSVLLAWQADRLFPFAPEFMPAARVLTLLFGAAVSLDMARSALSVGYFACERFDYEYGIMIVGGLIRLVLIIGLSEIKGASLAWIGVGTLAGAVWRTAGGLFFIRRLLPELHLTIRQFSRDLLRPIAVFTVEIMTAGVGLIILQQADILIAGWLLGPAMVTAYFCGVKWNFLLRAIFSAITTVLIPRVTTLQAGGREEDIRNLARQNERLLMPLGWLAASMLWIFAPPLIHIWVGPEQGPAVAVLRIIAFPMAVTVCSYVALAVLTGLGKIRESAISALVIGLGNAIVSIFLVLQFGWGLAGIALASAACLLVRNGVYIPVLACRYTGRPVTDYYRMLVLAALSAAPSLIAGYFTVHYITLSGWIELLAWGMLCAVPSLLLIFRIVWKPEDRTLFRNLLRSSDRSGRSELDTR
jgi:membrane protein EpsK